MTLRRGGTGEAYRGIRKDEVHLEGRPVLADEAGAFGNPTSDSERTCVTPGTRSLWMVIFAPAGYPETSLQGHIRSACDLAARHLAPAGGSVATSGRIAPRP